MIIDTSTTDDTPISNAPHRLRWESPDEDALVRAAAEHFGVRFAGRENNQIVVTITGSADRLQHPLRFELLATIPFDSTRKCMSVLVRRHGSVGGGGVVLYSKGADDVLLPLSIASSSSAKEVQQHLELFAEQGARGPRDLDHKAEVMDIWGSRPDPRFGKGSPILPWRVAAAHG